MPDSLSCLTDEQPLGVEIAKPMDVIVSGWIFTSMLTRNSLLAERVCRGRESKD